MKIPKEFKLFGTTISIVWDNEKLNDKHVYGTYEYVESRITLSTTKGLRKMSQDLIDEVFYHEKVHAILCSMGEDDLSNNEKFVEVFSRLLKQSDETSRF